MSSEVNTEDRVAFSFADDQENKKMLTWQGMYIFRILFFVKSWQWAWTQLDVSWRENNISWLFLRISFGKSKTLTFEESQMKPVSTGRPWQSVDQGQLQL